MYGLVGKITATEGNGAELAAILAENVNGMPGCISYIVAVHATSSDEVWVTEVWDNAEAHVASLQLPSVQDAIARARPLIVAMTRLGETKPVAGTGWAPPFAPTTGM